MSTRGKAFADALERYIRNTAEEILTTAPHWSDRCDTPGRKVSYQAERLSLTCPSLPDRVRVALPTHDPYDHSVIIAAATSLRMRTHALGPSPPSARAGGFLDFFILATTAATWSAPNRKISLPPGPWALEAPSPLSTAVGVDLWR